MADYDNDNSGAIWKNEDKKTDNHPDFTGSAEVDGVVYRVAAWKRPANVSKTRPALTFRFTKHE